MIRIRPDAKGADSPIDCRDLLSSEQEVVTSRMSSRLRRRKCEKGREQESIESPQHSVHDVYRKHTQVETVVTSDGRKAFRVRESESAGMADYIIW